MEKVIDIKTLAWENQALPTICGGYIETSIKYPTVISKFVSVTVTDKCAACPYLAFCSLILTQPERVEPKKEETPTPDEILQKIIDERAKKLESKRKKTEGKKDKEPKEVQPKAPKQIPNTPPVVIDGKKLYSVYAFTGMRIGELEVVAETEETIEILSKSSQALLFDRKTGLQINCKNPRFANRIHV